MEKDILPGMSFPLGATVTHIGERKGVNFCIFSQHCTAVELLLFDKPQDEIPTRIIKFDPNKHCTYHYWHIFVEGLQEGQIYGYRVYGPFDPEHGHRYDGSKLLLDPYATAVVNCDRYSHVAATRPGDNAGKALKAAVVDRRSYDWEGDQPLHIPLAKSIIYELHVDAFTRHPSAKVPDAQKGTYAGLIEKIPYLKELGVTCVELMPVQLFDKHDAPPGKENYWGYSPIGFFAPHMDYSSDKTPLGPVNEFRDMVKAFHKAGIEVILDVVFNHTNEGNYNGPTVSFRGLENSQYYILENNKALYANYSGCGNTLNTNNSIVRRLIMDCLRYWVSEMHVDGFRFDLASVMSRDEWGVPLKSPPILWDIETDPVLAGSKIIAEAWDAGGLYQVGSFIGHRWSEWNGHFRDDVRKFVKGDPGMVPALASRLTGSRDVYPKPDRDPNRSINFISCHDGFTLNDLVCYNHKHNDANGEGNRDGHNENLSWNCGVEGHSDDANVQQLREKQAKNLMTLLMISEGTPMFHMGDEIMKTKQGNNNTYCQNNELNWLNWEKMQRHKGMHRFVKKMIHLTRKHELFHDNRFWLAPAEGEAPRLTWHGMHQWQPDWSSESRAIAFSLVHPNGDHFHVMINAFWEPLHFELANLPEESCWVRIVDTSLVSPNDFSDLKDGVEIGSMRYIVDARSIVILQEKTTDLEKSKAAHRQRSRAAVQMAAKRTLVPTPEVPAVQDAVDEAKPARQAPRTTRKPKASTSAAIKGVSSRKRVTPSKKR